MNKKILFLVFLIVLILVWNIVLIMITNKTISKQVEYENLKKSNSLAGNQQVNELLAVYNHKSGQIMYMPMEEYIICVLSAEMPVSYGIEALKAQAVAARTYTLYCIHNKKESFNNADVCTDYKHCQAFKSMEETKENTNSQQFLDICRAVRETSGEIITYNNETINAVYHACSDKKTEDAVEVWGEEIPYLVSVNSRNENEMPGFESNLIISKEGFIKKLNMSGYDIEYNMRFTLSTSVNSSGRVSTLNIENENGIVNKIKATEIRSVFSLRSCSFKVEIKDDNVYFYVKGYGHGVGMSQYGAKLMAQQGKTYKEILTYYYSGCEVEKI
ncbi:MAG: stage II sporulation protein D [Clostridia bacterium]|nr:stage II sporulation protein D [Clostridia bacterium]